MQKTKLNYIEEGRMIEHSKMVEYYRQNEQVKNFIIKFFKVRKGFRARVIQNYAEDKIVRYQGYHKHIGTVDTDNFWDQMDISGTLFFYEMIFNKERADRRNIGSHKLKLELSTIGSSTVFDIDAPSVDGHKVDFFEIWEEFDHAKAIVEKELQELGIKYNCMFSGNGIYVICQSMYFDEMKIMKDLDDDFTKMDLYNDTITRMILDINKKLEMDGLKVGIDSSGKHWAKYHKVPFTYQHYRERISIPIERGKIWIEQLKCASNANNFFKGIALANINSITLNADWKNIW